MPTITPDVSTEFVKTFEAWLKEQPEEIKYQVEDMLYDLETGLSARAGTRADGTKKQSLGRAGCVELLGRVILRLDETAVL